MCMLHHARSGLREHMRPLDNVLLVRILSWWSVVMVGGW